MKLRYINYISILVILAVLGITSCAFFNKFHKESRWESLFNGKNLEGWIQKNGTATYRVEDGAIIGKTTKGSPNSFLCTENEYSDFDLTFEVILYDNDLNSGVQVRSKTFEPRNGQDFGQVSGPQVEIMTSINNGGSSGYIWGEGMNRGWISPVSKKKRHKVFKDNEWNSFRILAVGARIQTWINGEQIDDVTDEEAFKTNPKGFIGLQVHGIPLERDRGPLQVAWRNIQIKALK
ncbi:DUF1080 domain-containing protein [uncultured Draconibacterium sp.]|uniref:3-keto-disaccharide hydrolase n=1 Tax=uncultured Draconibacterium sp. TaxID=1573823 RepID=UPI0025D217D0|nr:DUF1080 domain-containing protein [uncultured Draconibacterium sp.]